MTQRSRSKATSWPFPRHRIYEVKLRVSNQKWFSDRGYAVNRRMPYLLARWEDWTHNIILPEVAQYLQEELAIRAAAQESFPLHRYVHHGLSSQAMLFNLIGPLVVRHDYAPLRRALETCGIPWPLGEIQACFEYEDRSVFHEETGQPISIDLMIEGLEQSPALFVESKLTEREFGGCSIFSNGDCDGRSPVGDFNQCYLHWIGRRYWRLLEAKGFLDGPFGQEKLCPLAMHYQFFREVLFALAQDGVFVLLYDERNPTYFCREGSTVRGLMPLLLDFVPEEHKERVKWVSIQKVIAAVKAAGSHPWIREFEAKYGFLVFP